MATDLVGRESDGGREAKMEMRLILEMAMLLIEKHCDRKRIREREDIQ